MNKQEILNKFLKEDNKLLVSKVLDKYQYCISKNKISSTNFINLAEKAILEKILVSQKIKNHVFYGGFDSCERCILIFYPEKYDLSIVHSNFSNILEILRIELPKELHSKYNHRNYLGGLLKLGIAREKIGDILVFETGADIIISKDVSQFLYSNIPSLTRFAKSKIDILDIKNLREKENQKEEIKIIVPSLRLDSIVAELCHTSRAKSCEIIESEKVFVNFISVTKTNTFLKENDIISIRRNGKYNIAETLGTTKKGNIILKIEKYK